MPALGAFVLVFGLYSFLVSRSNAISQAAEQRKEALEAVRQSKSNQITGKDVGAAYEESIDVEVKQAVAAYEKAILNEESLRTLAPGIRIRAPNGIWSEEDKLAAKQLAGIDFQQEDEKQEPRLKMLFDEKDGRRGFSSIAVVIMGLLVTTLLGVQIFFFNLEYQASSSLGGL